MIREEVMKIADQCIKEDMEFLRRLASEEFANKRILKRERAN